MIKTIAKVGYALLKEDAEGNITYDKIIWFKSKEAGGREFSAEPNGETTPIWADGQRVFIAEENQGYDIKLILIDILDNIDKDWLGNILTDDGTLEINSSNERPRFALLVANETLKGTTKYSVDTYYNCMVSARPSKTSKTSEGSIDPQFPEYSISAMPRPDNNFVRYTQKTDELPTDVVVPTISDTPAVVNSVAKSSSTTSSK